MYDSARFEASEVNQPAAGPSIEYKGKLEAHNYS